MWNIHSLEVKSPSGISLHYSDGKSVTKDIAASGGVNKYRFSHEALLNIGALLVHIEELKRKYPTSVRKLFLTLFKVPSMKARPARRDVASAITSLLQAWFDGVEKGFIEQELLIEGTEEEEEEIVEINVIDIVQLQ